jgi:diaminohydroxyphosphoribosylaminopyrimidine deaminase/5-amino-6-(5-phosphoribosylamino)uracil reductase
LQDPDPRVDGGGIARLRAAGIEVRTGVLQTEAARLQRGFLSRVRDGRPMLTLKLAGSFDGRIATATGESRWITGPEARRLVHAMRARHDAVLVGAGTARADDPSLTVRGLGVAHQPVRVVWSRHLDLPLTGRLAATAREVPVWICHGESVDPGLRQAWEGIGARLLPVPIGLGRQIDPAGALQAMGAAGLTRVFCEGGGALAASLLTAGLVDELVGFTAGLALGAEGQPGLGAMGVDRLAEAPRFRLVGARPVGADVVHFWERDADSYGCPS